MQVAADEDAEVHNEEIDYALDIESAGDAQAGGREVESGPAGSEAGGDSASSAEARAQGSDQVDAGASLDENSSEDSRPRRRRTTFGARSPSVERPVSAQNGVSVGETYQGCLRAFGSAGACHS